MSRNKVKQEKTHKSILAQFFILLVGLGLLCGALFLVLHTTVGSALESYVYSSDFLSNVTEKRVNDLQEYVTENQVSATDSQALSQWMRGKPLTLMEVYRFNVLVYSSYASYSLAVEGGDFTWTATEGEETPTYDWISYYTVTLPTVKGKWSSTATNCTATPPTPPWRKSSCARRCSSWGFSSLSSGL